MHIVWDWNGTLLSDIEAVVAAANHALAPLGAGPLDLAAYRERFSRPVRAFNEAEVGRPLTDAEWVALDAAFHQHYWGVVETLPLAADALDALDDATARGWTQSLLSMAPHHHLLDVVARHGIGERFTRVDGNHGEVGAPKETNLRAHLATLGLSPADVWMIGDAVDDARAARAVGAGIVLVATASCHSRAVLEEQGAPVVDSLVDALAVVASRHA